MSQIYRKIVDVEKSFDAWIMFVNNFNLIFIFIYIECQRFCLRVDVVRGKSNLVILYYGEFHAPIKLMSDLNTQSPDTQLGAIGIRNINDIRICFIHLLYI